MSEFEKELESLVNKHSIENESDTPDFILAQYLTGCLTVFTTAIQRREKWNGRDPRPTLTTEVDETYEQAKADIH